MKSKALGTQSKQLIAFAIGWAFTIGAALSLHALPVDLGHGICGPWGCGPPTLTLVSCHLAWIAVLGPPAWWLFRRFSDAGKRISIAGVVASGLVIMGIAAYVHLRWLPSVSEYFQAYGWQRVAFVIATAVEYPILQVGVLAVVVPAFQRKISAR